LQEILTDIVASHASKLDPKLPSILAAHVWVSGAKVGSEELETIGQEPALLLSNISHPAFDYIALGHIHKSQVMSQNPPVVYSGSLERLDFGEEKDEKGFYLVEIENGKETDKKEVSFEFHPVDGRRFLTIDIDIEPQDVNPTESVLGALLRERDKIREAIVRLNIALPAELEAQLVDSDIKNTLKEAYFFIIARDVKRETRLRLGGLSGEEMTPFKALKTYLESKYPPERAKTLLEHGEKFIHEYQAEEDKKS
jgi:exonuclease SbcD